MQRVGRLILWALVVSFALAAVILFFLFRYVLPAPGTARSTARYTIGEWEGQVAVFEGDQDFPRQVFDVYVNALPEQQRQQVLEGVPVEDETQLSILLEDYTS
ncbi:MAG: BofC C-terminal domain-containing protein [Clostridia bacterium]|nr:BofC C-terminal domain-containing protein [Clostridia bacterium]